MDKTKYLTFSIRVPKISPDEEILSVTAHKHIVTNIHATCDCPKLEKTTTVKYLGVILDDRLSFVHHLNHLSGRIRKLIFVFKHLRHVAEPKVLKMAYYALCQSVTGYCISSWGGASKTHILRVERAQRAVLKVSTFKPFRYPTKDLYPYCQVLTVRQLFILRIIIRQHSIVSSSGSQLTTRRHKLPYGTTCRTSFSQKFFYFLGRFVYNKLNKVNTRMVYNNKSECKNIAMEWLLKLSYDDTENLLHPMT